MGLILPILYSEHLLTLNTHNSWDSNTDQTMVRRSVLLGIQSPQARRGTEGVQSPCGRALGCFGEGDDGSGYEGEGCEGRGEDTRGAFLNSTSFLYFFGALPDWVDGRYFM